MVFKTHTISGFNVALLLIRFKNRLNTTANDAKGITRNASVRPFVRTSICSCVFLLACPSHLHNENISFLQSQFKMAKLANMFASRDDGPRYNF